jgi:hypothetical protein
MDVGNEDEIMRRMDVWGQMAINREERTCLPLAKEEEMDAIKPKERRTLTRTSEDTIEPVRLRLEEGAIVAKVQDITVAGFSVWAIDLISAL